MNDDRAHDIHDWDKVTSNRIPRSAAVATALQKSKVVQQKVESCAEDLSRTNDHLKQKLAEGAMRVEAHSVLVDTDSVERRVRECNAELHDVADTLMHGVDDLRRIERALAQSQTELADTQVALAVATEAESTSRHKALHDGLTGLPNRELFQDRLMQAIAVAGRHEWSLAVLFLDLDHFKQINDTHGHAAGDAVLQATAQRLIARCREEDTVSRFGGDEFLFLLMHPQGRDNIEHVAKDVLKSISLPINSAGLQLRIQASIGISVYPDDGMTSEELIHLADKAMYQAKSQKLGIRFFSSPSPVSA